jgi:hypothetical protein
VQKCLTNFFVTPVPAIPEGKRAQARREAVCVGNLIVTAHRVSLKWPFEPLRYAAANRDNQTVLLRRSGVLDLGQSHCCIGL